MSVSEQLSKQAELILRESNTLLEGDHFVYISGDHGSGWVNKDALLPHTHKVSMLANLLAEAVRDIDADVVCGPAIGGLVMSQWVAHHLSLPSVFAEHGTDNKSKPGMRPPFILKRGFEKLVRDKRILVVDDIVNTGHSMRQTGAAISAAGGVVVAAAAYCSRGNVDAAGMNMPKFVYLTEFKIPSWSASSCKLCKDGIPVNIDYAHGLEFVEYTRQLQK